MKQIKSISDKILYSYERDVSAKKIVEAAVTDGVSLWGADLEGANLKGADLQGANLEGANLQGANLWKAVLRRAHLEGADLEGANLKGANLWGADLQRANLKGANLWRADLGGAYLGGADLGNADLQEANLKGADLWRADLRGAVYSILNIFRCRWPNLSNELTLELMAHDAEFIGDKPITDWAISNTPCPYKNKERDFLFKEKKELWVSGTKPKYRGKKLFEKLCEECNIKI